MWLSERCEHLREERQRRRHPCRTHTVALLTVGSPFYSRAFSSLPDLWPCTCCPLFLSRRATGLGRTGGWRQPCTTPHFTRKLADNGIGRQSFFVCNVCGGGCRSGLECLLLERPVRWAGEKSRLSFMVCVCLWLERVAVGLCDSIFCTHSTRIHRGDKQRLSVAKKTDHEQLPVTEITFSVLKTCARVEATWYRRVSLQAVQQHANHLSEEGLSTTVFVCLPWMSGVTLATETAWRVVSWPHSQRSTPFSLWTGADVPQEWLKTYSLFVHFLFFLRCSRSSAQVIGWLLPPTLAFIPSSSRLQSSPSSGRISHSRVGWQPSQTPWPIVDCARETWTPRPVPVRRMELFTGAILFIDQAGPPPESLDNAGALGTGLRAPRGYDKNLVSLTSASWLPSEVLAQKDSRCRCGLIALQMVQCSVQNHRQRQHREKM